MKTIPTILVTLACLTLSSAAFAQSGAKGNGQTSDGMPSDLHYMPAGFKPPGRKIDFKTEYAAVHADLLRLIELMRVRGATFPLEFGIDQMEFYETETLSHAEELTTIEPGRRQFQDSATYEYPEVTSNGRTLSIHRVIEIKPSAYRHAPDGSPRDVRYQSVSVLHELLHYHKRFGQHQLISPFTKALFAVSKASDRQSALDPARISANAPEISAEEYEASYALQGFLVFPREVISDADAAKLAYSVNRNGGGVLLQIGRGGGKCPSELYFDAGNFVGMTSTVKALCYRGYDARANTWDQGPLSPAELGSRGNVFLRSVAEVNIPTRDREPWSFEGNLVVDSTVRLGSGVSPGNEVRRVLENGIRVFRTIDHASLSLSRSSLIDVHGAVAAVPGKSGTLNERVRLENVKSQLYLLGTSDLVVRSVAPIAPSASDCGGEKNASEAGGIWITAEGSGSRVERLTGAGVSLTLSGDRNSLSDVRLICPQALEVQGATLRNVRLSTSRFLDELRGEWKPGAWEPGSVIPQGSEWTDVELATNAFRVAGPLKLSDIEADVYRIEGSAPTGTSISGWRVTEGTHALIQVLGSGAPIPFDPSVTYDLTADPTRYRGETTLQARLTGVDPWNAWYRQRESTVVARRNADFPKTKLGRYIAVGGKTFSGLTEKGEPCQASVSFNTSTRLGGESRRATVDVSRGAGDYPRNSVSASEPVRARFGGPAVSEFTLKDHDSYGNSVDVRLEFDGAGKLVSVRGTRWENGHLWTLVNFECRF
jgi:hypothetical protein